MRKNIEFSLPTPILLVTASIPLLAFVYACGFVAGSGPAIARFLGIQDALNTSILIAPYSPLLLFFYWNIVVQKPRFTLYVKAQKSRLEGKHSSFILYSFASFVAFVLIVLFCVYLLKLNFGETYIYIGYVNASAVFIVSFTILSALRLYVIPLLSLRKLRSPIVLFLRNYGYFVCAIVVICVFLSGLDAGLRGRNGLSREVSLEGCNLRPHSSFKLILPVSAGIIVKNDDGILLFPIECLTRVAFKEIPSRTLFFPFGINVPSLPSPLAE